MNNFNHVYGEMCQNSHFPTTQLLPDTNGSLVSLHSLTNTVVMLSSNIHTTDMIFPYYEACRHHMVRQHSDIIPVYVGLLRAFTSLGAIIRLLK